MSSHIVAAQLSTAHHEVSPPCLCLHLPKHLCLLPREEAIPWMAPCAPCSPCSPFPKAGEKNEALQTQLTILTSHQSQDTMLWLSQL